MAKARSSLRGQPRWGVEDSIIRNPLKRAMISKSKSTQLHNTIGMKKEEPRNQ